MEEQEKNEKLIGKLIRKRKQENTAFLKLLNAMESQGTPATKDKKTPKS